MGVFPCHLLRRWLLTDGITEDILTHLSRIAGLSVVSRTSIMQYKNTEKTIRQIGEELGVATVLEGSVRRAGEMIRITGQLIDARTDKHLWADMYDREFTDIFLIQSEVALRIADALQATLSMEELDEIQSTPTDSIAAYDFYLQGNAFLHRSRMRNASRSYLEQAIEMYEKSIDIDPEFLLAYAKLTIAHVWMYWPGMGGYDQSEARLEMAKRTLDIAKSLNPDHPQTHEAAGWYHHYRYRDYETAIKEFGLALEHQPNNSELLEDIGYVLRRQGKYKEGVRSLRKAVELDPLNYVINVELAKTYMRMREWAEAERFNHRCLIISPEASWAHSNRISIIISSTGNIEAAMEAYEDYEKILDRSSVRWQVELAIYNRNYEKAFKIQKTRDGRFENKAWLSNALGYSEQAIAYYDTMRARAEEEIVNTPESGSLHGYLGKAYAGLGRKEEAIREGKLAVELHPVSLDSGFGPARIFQLAEIYRLVGDYDAAVDQLEYLLSIPCFVTGPGLNIDPLWDPLRDHPRFQKLIAENPPWSTVDS